MAEQNLSEQLTKLSNDMAEKRSRGRKPRIKEHQIGRVLKKLGVFHLTDSSANLIIAYLAQLHFEFKHKLAAKVDEHNIAYQHLDYFLTKHALLYPKTSTKSDLKRISNELNNKLDKSPLAAMLATKNTVRNCADENWRLLQYYTAVACISLLVSHIKFVSAKNENILMPAIAAGLRRVRLTQSKLQYGLMLADLELDGSLKDFVENWKVFNSKVNQREGESQSKNISETIAYQRSGPLQNLIQKFWDNVSSQPNYERTTVTNRRSKMRFSTSNSRPFRIKPAVTRRKADLRDGEEVAVEQKSDFEILESEASHSHEFKTNNYARQKQAAAILARNIRAELGIPAIPELLTVGHMKLLISALELHNEDSKHYQVDAWIFLIIYLSQTYDFLLKAYFEKKYKVDDLRVTFTASGMLYKLERNLSTHARVEKVGLLESRENEFSISLPRSLANERVFPKNEADFPSEADIRARLQDICAAQQISRVSINQLASWQFLFLSRFWPERCSASIVAGFQPRDWTPLYYCTLDVFEVQRRHAAFWSKMSFETDHFHLAHNFDVLYPAEYEKQRYGSTLRLKLDKVEKIIAHFRNYIEQLKQSVESESSAVSPSIQKIQQQRQELHNAYTVYVLLIVKMLTGIRPVDGYFSSIADFDFLNDRVYINDKQRREGMARIVPMCATLKRQLVEYITYLTVVANEPVANPAHLASTAEAACLSQAEPFQVYRNDNLEPITPSFLESYLSNLFPVPLNFARHVLRTWFYKYSSLNSVIVDDFMSHDLEGQMSQGLYSAYCAKDEEMLRHELERFSIAMLLVVVDNPVKPLGSVEIDEFTSLPHFVDQRSISQFEKTTDRMRRLKKKRQRENRIEKNVKEFIADSCPELMRGEGTDQQLSICVNKVREFIDTKYQQAEIHIASFYLMKVCDLVNDRYGRSITLPTVPVKLSREPAMRDPLALNLAQRAAIANKFLQSVQFSLDELTDTEIRCLLVLITATQASQNSKRWLQGLFARSYEGLKLNTSVINNYRLIWLALVSTETSVVNDLNHESGAVHLEYIFLNGLQAGLVTQLIARKSKSINDKLSDIPKILQSSKLLACLSRAFLSYDGSSVAVATLFKFAVDSVASVCRDYSFALRHTANSMIETYSLPQANFEYFLQPTLNEVLVPPSVSNLIFEAKNADEPQSEGREKRKRVKQAIGLDSLDLYQSLTRLFRANSKLSKNQVIIELEKLIEKYAATDSVVYLLNWFVFHLKIRKNGVSSVRRYHSAITLNWLMATVVIDDLSELSGADFHDLYRNAIEFTQSETQDDIESDVGAEDSPGAAKIEEGLSKDEREHEKKRHLKRHEEQISREKSFKSYNYLCDTFERLHNYLVSEYQLPPLDEPIRSKISQRKEHVRAGYIPHQLYQAILAKLPLTRGCDDDTKFALQVITILAYRTGMRINEILTLTIKDITTIKERWIRVRNNPFGRLKSISSRRDVAAFCLLTKEELRLFNMWVERRTARCRKRNELLFCDADSPRKVWPEWLIKQSIVAWMRALSGLNKLTFQHFRHTALSNLQLLIENEIELFCCLTGHDEKSAHQIIKGTLGGAAVNIDRYYALAMVAGHSSPSVTFKSYIHFSALIRHIKISETYWHYTRNEVKAFTRLSDKQIAQICLPDKKSESFNRKRPRRKSDYVDAQTLLEYLAKTNKTLIREITPRPTKVIEFASDTLLLKASASDVHDILQAVVDGKSNREISQLYQVDESLIERYREQARSLLSEHTLIKNRRLISKKDEAKNIYMPPKPYTEKERNIARNMINKMVNTPSVEQQKLVLALADYFIKNIHPDEPGARFRDEEILNWFVSSMQPYISLKSWFIRVVTRKKDKANALTFLTSLVITTKRPAVKLKKQGKPEFYLRLKHPDPDKRQQNAKFQSTSLLKYVFAMVAIMIRAELPDDVSEKGDDADINQHKNDGDAGTDELNNTKILELSDSS
jgi:integrase